MNITSSLEQSFYIVGIATRTTNEQAIQHGSIQALWNKFFMDQILSKIENRIDNAILAVYYDFESDKSGEYTILLGARVSSIVDLPAGMIGLSVPAENRTIFLSEQGPIGTVVIDCWMKIWNMEDQNKIDRTYGYEYELYDARSNNPAHAQVAIHIGIKSLI